MPDKVEEGFIRVEDKIYSAEKLADFHPGGPLFIKVPVSLQSACVGRKIPESRNLFFNALQPKLNKLAKLLAFLTQNTTIFALKILHRM
jgi:hypothetical protein